VKIIADHHELMHIGSNCKYLHMRYYYATCESPRKFDASIEDRERTYPKIFTTEGSINARR